jgi:uncharacterized protein GlcG (DUF336 family)
MQSECCRAGEARATVFCIPYNIAVVDVGAHLIGFVRQDGALIGCIELAIDKAVTARFFDKTTSFLASLSQSGKPLFGYASVFTFYWHFAVQSRPRQLPRHRQSH